MDIGTLPPVTVLSVQATPKLAGEAQRCFAYRTRLQTNIGKFNFGAPPVGPLYEFLAELVSAYRDKSKLTLLTKARWA